MLEILLTGNRLVYDDLIDFSVEFGLVWDSINF